MQEAKLSRLNDIQLFIFTVQPNANMMEQIQVCLHRAGESMCFGTTYRSYSFVYHFSLDTWGAAHLSQGSAGISLYSC